MTEHQAPDSSAPPAPPKKRRRWLRVVLPVLFFLCAIEMPNPFEEFFWGLFSPTRIDRVGAPVQPRIHEPSRMVLLISFDGLARTVLAKHTPSTIADLARDGTVATFATDIATSTLESHGVMVSSQSMEESGFSAHTYRPWSHFRGPTIFTVCAREGWRCGLFTGKIKLAALVAKEPGCERFEYRRDKGKSGDGPEVLDTALAYIHERDPDFVMIHLPDVDVVGHRSGWGSDEQLEALTRLDQALSTFLIQASMATSRHLAVVVTADHGGRDKAHRDQSPEVSQVPWILWGPGIQHSLISSDVSELDTAPTIAALLGVDPPPEWRGHPLVPVAGR